MKHAYRRLAWKFRDHMRPHGYLFGSAEEAKEAAETEIKRRVSEKVKSALAVLDTYTDVPIGGYNE